MLKVAVVLVKNVLFGLKKGIRGLVSQIAAKHTATDYLKNQENGQKIAKGQC